MPNEAQEQRSALMAALGSQQKIIDRQTQALNTLWNGLQMIASYAGLSQELEGLNKVADVNNPAAPIADPASEAAPESTEQALESATHDNVAGLGSTPGANEHVPAEMTTTPMQPGVSIPTQPYNNLINVTAPVSGTETHIPNDQTRIETDVRVGDPDNPQVAFPWNPGMDHAGPKAANRTFASLKLAKLRLVAGVEQGEELEIAGRIEANAALSDEMIAHETSVLEAVRKSASARTAPQQTRHLVPRTASQERANPSLQTESLGLTVAGIESSDTEDSDLFLGGFGSE